MGFRFRLHGADLPGKPDIVFPKHRVAMFVHGCFWHRHCDCPKATTPKSRVDYWQNKFAANVARDERSVVALEKLDWRVAVIWECQTRDPEALKIRLKDIFWGTRSETIDGSVTTLIAEDRQWNCAINKLHRCDSGRQ